MYQAFGLINRGANVGKSLVIFAFSPWFSPKNSLARFSRKVQLRPRLRTTTHQKFTKNSHIFAGRGEHHVDAVWRRRVHPGTFCLRLASRGPVVAVIWPVLVTGSAAHGVCAAMHIAENEETKSDAALSDCFLPITLEKYPGHRRPKAAG